MYLKKSISLDSNDSLAYLFLSDCYNKLIQYLDESDRNYDIYLMRYEEYYCKATNLGLAPLLKKDYWKEYFQKQSEYTPKIVYLTNKKTGVIDVIDVNISNKFKLLEEKYHDYFEIN